MFTSFLRSRAGVGLVLALALGCSLRAAAAAESEAAERIHKALAENTDIEFVETPLQDVVDFVSDKHNVQIMLDIKALEAASFSISTDSPITTRLKGIPLSSALELMLGRHDLTALIHSDVLLITTFERANALVELRVYDAAELLGEDDATKLASIVQQATSFTPNGNSLSASPAPQPNNVKPAAKELTPIVYSVTPCGNTLIIRANQPGHAEIDKLFSQLQTKLRKTPISPPPAPAPGGNARVLRQRYMPKPAGFVVNNSPPRSR